MIRTHFRLRETTDHRNDFYLRLIFTLLFPSGTLQITASTEEDKGKYECVAENEFGTEYSQSTMLYVKGKSICFNNDYINAQ